MRAKKLMAGPLQIEVDAFAAELARVGYGWCAQYHYVRVAQRLDDYLARHEVKSAGGVLEHLGGFRAEMSLRRKTRRPTDSLAHYWGRALDLLVRQLREHGVLPALPVAQLQPRLAEYLGFLSEHLGLRPSTIRRHKDFVETFLEELGARTDSDLAAITVEDIDEHMIAASRRFARRSIGLVSGCLRGFLGHLFMRGVLPTDLRQHVVTPRLYSLESVPRAISWKEVQRTIASVRGDSLLARRDYAILALLAVHGLRASEVANLERQDIDWRRDIIHVHRSKVRSEEEVPLSTTVGEAIIAYLKKRPTETEYPQLFLTVRAPIVPLRHDQIALRARRRLRRAGVQGPHLGSHTLRHSHAMHLLRRGFSLKAIGDVLGHRRPQSTMVYTKAATDDLREVAQEIDGVLP